ncbi:MAG: putative Ig domain-containing protein [Verrucomicrobia bacterium]|nr:putative Ig domain-containing protein [Verrucomicrobiota bacterium]
MKVSSLRVFGLGLLLALAGELGASAQSSSTNVVRGSIDVPGERDVYTFSLANRARYYFDALTNVSSIVWSLESATGTIVDSRQFGSSDAGNASALSLEPGFYRLTVDGTGNTTNAYAFRFVDLATAGLISPGTLVTNRLSPGTRTDFYQFNSLAGDRLLFDRITTPPAGNIWWRLLDPFGNEVFSSGYSDVNNITQRVDGVHTLMIEGYVGNVVAAPYSFTVVLQGNTPPVPFSGTPMNIGALVSGTMTNASTNDYVFSVASTTRVVIDSLTNSPSINWTLEGPPGLLVNNQALNGTDGQSGTPPKELSPGDYRLRLRRTAASTGPFAFRLLDLTTATAITPGVPVNATHSPGQETDMFRFDAAAGSRIFVDTFSTNGVGNGTWRLLDPYLNLVTSGGERTDRGPLTLNLTGTYTLLFEGYFDDNSAQPYRFNVIPVSDAAQTLTVGALTSGSIDVPGQSQQYLFSLGAPSTLYFDSRTNHSAIRWNLDGPTGRRVSNRAFNSSDGTSSGDPLILPEGDYTLTVAGSGDAVGGFSFRLFDFASATPITLGTPVNSTLSPANETDAYRFFAAAGTEVYFNSVASTTLPNLYWRCYDPLGRTVLVNGFSDFGPTILPSTGIYTLVLEGYHSDPGSGTYSFNVQPLNDGTQALAIGDVVDGSITTAGQTQTYTFSLPTATSLYFDSLTNANVLRWSLIGPTGTLVNNRTFNSSDANSLFAVLNLSAGNYSIVVSGSSDNIGSYRFRVFDLAGAEPFTPGVPVSGTLNPGNQTRAYRFTLAAGTELYFDSIASAGLPNLYWRCVDPNGAVVLVNSFSDFGPAIQSAGGIYLLLVEGYVGDANSGTYTFNVVPVNDGSQPMTIGNTISGSITLPGQTQTHTFTLGSATQLYFDSLTNSPLRWTLTGPTGVLFNNRAFTSVDGPNGDARLNLDAGDYTVTISGSGDAVGGYRFRLLNTVANATVITPGTAITNTLAPGNETDLYRFTVAAGTRVYFNAITSSGLPNMYWRCYGPSGQSVLANSFSDSGPLTLESGGTYALFIEGHYIDSANGTYAFNVVPVNDATQPLTVGSVVTGTVAVPGQFQKYTFTLPTAATLYLDSQTNNGSLRWSLSRPGGIIVTNRTFTSSDAQSITDPILRLPSGNYDLVVSGSGDEIGTFRFRLFDLASATVLTPGVAVNGTLNPGNETDAYRFNATAGDRFNFSWITQTAIPNSYWRLIDPFGNRLFARNTSSVGTNQLLATGTYTVLVEGYITDIASGSYQFNVIPVGNLPITFTGAPLVMGATVSSNLPNATTTNSHTFTLASRTRLFFDVLVNTDFRWSLTGPEGDVVSNRSFQSSDGSDLQDSSLDLPAGNYRLNIFGLAGNYSFRLLDGASATPLTPGLVLSNAITPARATALYRFEATAGDRFYYDGRPTTGFANVPYIKFYGPEGLLMSQFQVTSDADVFTVPYTGTHLVSVEGRYSDNNPSGTFVFLLQPVVDATNNFAVGSTVNGVVTAPGQRQYHRFTLAAPTRVVFDSLTNRTFRWSLSGPSGVIVSQRALDNTDSYEFASLFNLPAGDYLVEIDPSNEETGPYAFRFIDASTATPFTPGNVVNGSVNPGIGTALYRFNATAGDRFFYDGRPRSGFSSSVYIRFYSPRDQIVVQQVEVASDIDVFSVPFTGEYLLAIEGRYVDTAPSGNFTFILQPVSDSTNNVAIIDTVSGTIATPGQRNFHPFSLAAPMRVLFDSLVNNTLRWTLTGPSGVIVSQRSFDSSDSYEQNALLNLAAGDYLIEIDGFNAETNSYAFRFVDSSSAIPFTLGTVVTGSVTPGIGTRVLRFDAVAGQRFYFDGRPFTGFSSTPYVRMYSPLGFVVMNQVSINSDFDTFTVPHSGTYLFTVEGRYVDTATNGNFTFLLQPVIDATNSIVIGELVSGTIGAPGQSLYHRFTLPAPARLIFDSLTGVSNLRWSLNGPDGRLIDPRSFDNSDSYEMTPLLNLRAGDYVIEVSGNASGTNSYAFRLLDPGTATPFTPGNLVTGSAIPGISTAMYRFDANAGDRFYYDGRPYTGFSTTPYVRILSPIDQLPLNQIGVNSDAETFAVGQSGTYLLLVEGRYLETSTNGNFSFLLAPNNPPPPSPLFETNVAPDLVVTGLAINPSAGLQSGQSATLQWTTRNNGNAATPGSFTERVTVRNMSSGQIVVNRTLFYDESLNGPINPGQTRPRQILVAIPDGNRGAGNLEVTVTTDTLNGIFEQNGGGTGEANNASSINITTTLAPYPDLQIASVTTTPLSGWQTGSVVTINWVTTNSGNRATVGSWNESVVVRNTNTSQTILNSSTNYAAGEPGNGDLAPNTSRTRTLSFVMPTDASAVGAFEVVVTTDSDSQIFENNAGGSAETNNARAVISASAPDLLVTSLNVTASPSLQSGAELTIRWAVTNQGNVPVSSAFYDRVTVRNTNTAEVLYNNTVFYNPNQGTNGAILPGGSRARELVMTLPDGARSVGRIEISVTADTFNNLPEHNSGGTGEANNVTSSQITVAARPYPDLVVTSVSGPALGIPGQQVPVVWTIRNNGTIAASGPWSDHLFLSADNQVGSDQFITSIAFNGTLNPSQTLTRTQVVTLPNFLNGSRFFVAEVDANSQVFEESDANNAGIAASSIVLQSALTLTLSPSTVMENGGNQASLATVSRNSSTASPLTVNLSSSVTNKISLPASVEIPVGGSSASFFIAVTDDLSVGGDVVAAIVAQAAGHTGATNQLTVRENDSPALRVLLSATTVAEDAAAGSVTGRVIRNVNTNVALTVTLSTDRPGTLTVPATVVIPVGATNVTFPLDPTDDDLVTGSRTVSIFASATGFSTVSTPITVLDDDSVSLTLTLSDTNVTEGVVNPAAFATLTRSPVSSGLLRVRLGTNGGGLVQVPAEVTIPANQPGVSFNVNVRDDALAFGAQVVNIVAQGLAADGSILPGASGMATIRVQDNDGPTLLVSTAVAVIAENSSTVATITRNTPATNSLTVAVTATPAGQATVQSSVTLALGQSSTNVTVNGVVDGVSDGAREVTIGATAAGFNPGSGLLSVTDIDVPDLAVVEVSGPTNALTDGLITAVWTVTNSGLATATAPWVDELYVATDAQGANATLYSRVTNSSPVIVGDSYTVARSLLLPSDPGNYWLLVRTDATGVVGEGSERNNSLLSAGISVQPSYRATVNTTVDSAISGTPIPLTGRTFFTSDGSPAPFRTATVRVNVNRVRRVLQVVSDASGNFNATFYPIPGEAGVYTIGADHPRVREDVVQDQFTLLGMGAVPWTLNVRLAPNVPTNGVIEFRNLSPLPLTGVSVSAENLPLDFSFAASVTNVLSGSQTSSINYEITTTLTTPVRGRFNMLVTSAEGAVTRIPVDFTVAPPTAQLVAEPASLNRGMLRGVQTVVQFDVVNIGGVASGDLNVALPSLPWMSIVSTSTIPSLAPGARATVVLALNPATNLPLTVYSGSLGLIGNNTGLSVPFQFRALSEARGDLLVTVTDEHTYFANGAPRVTNATVLVRDRVTGLVVADGATGTNGQLLINNLLEDDYILEVSAFNHSSVRGGVRIIPGAQHEQEVFLSLESVRYEWKVVPTEIDDRYRVVIEPLFETEVPQPNLVVENPLVMPLVFPGQTSQFEIRLRNTGLIALQRVRIPVPNHPKLVITPLVTELEELPAMSSVTVPVTIRVREPGESGDGFIQAAGGGGGCAGTECVVHMPVDTSFKCGQNFVTKSVSIEIQVVCVPDTGCQFDTVDVTRVDFMTANNIAFDAGFDCLLGKLDECQKARIRGYLKSGSFGTVDGPFGFGVSDFCACGPPEKIPSLLNAANQVMQSLGFTPTAIAPMSITYPPLTLLAEIPCNQGPSLVAAGGGNISAAGGPAPGSPVCAKVRLQLSQDIALTRNAFKGTLILENNSGAALTGIQLDLDFRDAANQSAAGLFGIRGPTLTGLSGVTGSGTLANNSSGAAEYIFIPTLDAAPLSPTSYYIGGTLRYTENGQQITIQLLPGSITVLPEARLTLDYFQQRDVYSDDPFTPEIEPAEPFALGLRIRNSGAGEARNFRINSAAPRIIENEKGLAIEFQLLGARVDNEPLNPSFNLNVGSIAPGTSKTVIWDMTSTLQGKFIDYRATFEHMDALGGLSLSLIDAVRIHEMIHVVRSDRAGDDTLPDFLVNDSPDPDNLPDVVYLSDSTTGAVAIATSPAVDSPATTNDLQVQLTATMSSGFAYLRMPNPGADFRLVSARRSDGKQLILGANVWTTDRTFPASQTAVVREKLLHLFDHNSTGIYTLTFAPILQDTNLPASSVTALPLSSGASFALQWSGDDGTNGSGIAFFDIFVSVNGGPFTNWLARTTQQSAVFNGVLGNNYAFYSLATDEAGNQELPPLSPDAQTSTTSGGNTVPSLVPIADATINEGGAFSFTPTVVDSDIPRQTLTFALLQSPSGATVDPTSGLLSWVTGESQGGTTNRFTLTVTDNGFPSLSATQSFNVIVREVNSAPTFVSANPQAEVDEGSLLSYTVAATDNDLPANTITWSLAAGAPAGMNINPANGLLTWTPGESDGPGEISVNVTLRDNGSPQQSAARAVRVIVREVNQAPVLAPISQKTAVVGTQLVVSNSVTDADLPAQKFTYSLAPGAHRPDQRRVHLDTFAAVRAHDEFRHRARDRQRRAVGHCEPDLQHRGR